MVEGTTGTDLVLKVVEMLRAKGVVGKFVEFYGPGLDSLPLADRATIANMAPEYGATCGFFPDRRRNPALPAHSPARDEDRIALVEAYTPRHNGMWRDAGLREGVVYTDTLELDMGTIVPAISGPKRPQDYMWRSRMLKRPLPNAAVKCAETHSRTPATHPLGRQGGQVPKSATVPGTRLHKLTRPLPWHDVPS